MKYANHFRHSGMIIALLMMQFGVYIPNAAAEPKYRSELVIVQPTIPAKTYSQPYCFSNTHALNLRIPRGVRELRISSSAAQKAVPPRGRGSQLFGKYITV